MLLRWWRERRAKRATTARCLAILLSRPRAIPVEELRAATERAYGKALPVDDDAQEFVTGPGPYMVKVDGYLVLVTVASRPQVIDPAAAAASMVDPALRAAFAQHRAFVSMLVLHAPDPQAIDRVYGHLAKLAAELLSEDALLVTSPERNSLVLVRDDLATRLRAGAVPELANAVELRGA